VKRVNRYHVSMPDDWVPLPQVAHEGDGEQNYKPFQVNMAGLASNLQPGRYEPTSLAQLGYDVKYRNLIVNKTGAETVRNTIELKPVRN
jgi:hypothetical protein